MEMETTGPATIGKYEILATLGRGGMGVVYRALDSRMGRQVAIKTVTEGLSNDSGMLQRFYREAEKMGMLKHPNIITVYDLGEQDGFPYIVMELVEGDALDKLIVSDHPMPIIYKLRVIEQVCVALGYAHQNDVVHRDVKPANVIVRPDGVAKLLDFGIARQEKNTIDRSLTATGGVIGTVPYMAPERLRGAPLDGRSDIFAAGVLLYQFLSGKLPFNGEEFVLVNQLLNEQPTPLTEYIRDYPPAIDTILKRALEKDPGERYQTAEEMAADLGSVIETLKKDYSQQLIQKAEAMSTGADYVGARDALVQLLKLDQQHTAARRLLADVNLRLNRKARVEQAQGLREKAEGALEQRDFDGAIRLLEEAARLVPDDTGLRGQLDSARLKKQTNEQIVGYLKQADEAKRGGNFAAAQAIVEKAIQLDTNNSRLRSAYHSLIRQAEDAAKQAKVQALLAAAKSALRQRDFAGALELTGKAEEIDSSHVELREIASAARDGLAQEERRRRLEEIELRLSAATTAGELNRVSEMVAAAMEAAPSDATLLRFQAQVDGRLHELESKRLVDETVRATHDLMERAPFEALQKVRALLERLPVDERLIALEANLQDRIARRSADASRNTILLEARDALQRREFGKAVSILEQCQGDLRTREIVELLEYSRQEEQRERQQKLIARTYGEAQALLLDGRQEEIVALLTGVLKSVEDVRLRTMLQTAQKTIERRKAELTSAIVLLTALTEAGGHEQVVAASAALPPELAGAPEIGALRAASQELWARDWARMEAIGRGYAALAARDRGGIGLASASGNDSTAGREMLTRFAVHRTAVVDEILAQQIERVQAEKPAGAGVPVAEDFSGNELLAAFASEPVRNEWTALAKRNTRKTGKLLGLMGKRNQPKA